LQEKVYASARHEIFNETNKEEVLADVTGFIDRALVTTGTSANAR
jgi:alpha-beta hydrolase superfamily lysophospholipase